MNREYLAAHPQPFIVWALQRTGGTNLTYKLDQISGLPSIDSEPFNPGHQYGQVTRNWLESRDRGRLDAAVQAVVDIGGIIKHCVEAVPWEISESLARASTLAGYRHLFLYRRNALNRLLSLRFAALTGIWNHEWKTRNNAQLAADGDPNQNVELAIESALELALPVEELVCREQLCVKLLNRAWAFLDALDANPVALAFEDVYQSDDTGSLLHVLRPFIDSDSSSYHAVLLRCWLDSVISTGGRITESLPQVLGPCASADSRSYHNVLLRCWLDSVIRFGEQGTRDKYSRFSGVSDLAERLQFVAPPCFSMPVDGKPLRWRDLSEDHAWVRRFFVDIQTKNTVSNQKFDIGGVLVVSAEAPAELELNLVGETSRIPLRWGQSSPKMAMKYPHDRNPAMARWSGAAVFIEGERRQFRLATADGREFTVGEIWLAGGENPDMTAETLV
jgi:hypothetical protein